MKLLLEDVDCYVATVREDLERQVFEAGGRRETGAVGRCVLAHWYWGRYSAMVLRLIEHLKATFTHNLIYAQCHVSGYFEVVVLPSASTADYQSDVDVHMKTFTSVTPAPGAWLFGSIRAVRLAQTAWHLFLAISILYSIVLHNSYKPLALVALPPIDAYLLGFLLLRHERRVNEWCFTHALSFVAPHVLPHPATTDF